MPHRRRSSLPALALFVLCACSGGDATPSYSEDRISFRYPEGWHVIGFSMTNDPHRLAVASYAIPPVSVEGDCGGRRALRALPPAGAIVLLIDYGDGGSFEPRRERLSLEDGAAAEYECFGQSRMFRFRVGRRDLQAFVALGAAASQQTSARALEVLATIEVAGES